MFRQIFKYSTQFNIQSNHVVCFKFIFYSANKLFHIYIVCPFLDIKSLHTLPIYINNTLSKWTSSYKGQPKEHKKMKSRAIVEQVPILQSHRNYFILNNDTAVYTFSLPKIYVLLFYFYCFTSLLNSCLFCCGTNFINELE